MYKYRYRKEDFGYIVSFPSGWVDLYDVGAKELIEGRKINELKKYPPMFDSKNLIKNRIIGINQKNKYKELLSIDNPLKSPLVVQLELTLKCNLQCKHCFNSAGEAKKNELSFEEIKDIIKQLKELEIFSLFLTGGEPTLREDFVDIVDYANKLNMDYFILTNGMTITEELLSKLPKRSFFVISCDGISTHKKIRGVSFRQIEEVFNLLTKKGFPFCAQYTLQKDNLKGIIEAYDWFFKKRIDFGAIDLYMVGRAKEHPEIFPTKDQLPLIEKIIKKKFEFEKKQQEFYKKYKEKLNVPNPDMFTFIGRMEEIFQRSFSAVFFTYIDSEGNIYPDNWHNADKLFSGGNLREKSFKEIWDRSFKEIRELGKWKNFNDCKKCELSRYFCDSRLPVLSRNVGGGFGKCGATPIMKKIMALRIKLREYGYGFSVDKARAVDIW